MEDVRKLEGISDIERKERIIKRIKDIGYIPKIQKYSYLANVGENIVLNIGRGKRIIAVTHYDVVSGSPGANDNCSTIAVIFDIMKKLRSYKPKNQIVILISDQEEIGCIGSRAYLKKHGTGDIIAVYNMELVGMGDMLGIWPVTENDSPALINLRKTIKGLGYYFEEVGNLPLFFGDYKAFRDEGIKDAFCISVIDKEDKDIIRKFVKTPVWLLNIKLLLKLIRIPRMFKYYHTKDDKSEHLNEFALRMTSDVLYNALVNMDKIS